MMIISAPEMAEAIRNIVIGMKKPAMFWGPPGVGKSQIAKQVGVEFDATEENNCFVDIRLSQYDSVDLRGVPVPDLDREVTLWHMPSTLPFKGNPKFNPKAKVIILLLDELNSGQQGVLAAIYQLILDRRVGEHELMDNVVIMACGNRETDRGVTTRMPTPIANRLTHFELQCDVDAVTIHYQDIGLPPVGIAFLHFRKPLLFTFDPAKPDKAFATPRSWETALRYYQNDKLSEKIKLAAISGAIGSGPAHEFFGFIDVWHKIVPVSRIIADPERTPVPQEESMRYATAVNISGELDTKNASKLHKYLKRMEPTYLILAWHLASKRDRSLFTCPEFLQLAKEYKAVFAA